MKACSLDMFTISAAFTKGVKKSKIRIGSVLSKVWIFIVRLSFLICTVTSSIAFDDLISFVIISQYCTYAIGLSNRLFSGLIERESARGGPVGLEWKGSMFGVEAPGFSLLVT